MTVLAQQTGNGMHVERGPRFFNRLNLDSPPAHHIDSALDQHRFALHELIDMREDVFLHGIAPVDIGAQFRIHLVPWPIDLRLQPALEGRQILVK